MKNPAIGKKLNPMSRIILDEDRARSSIIYSRVLSSSPIPQFNILTRVLPESDDNPPHPFIYALEDFINSLILTGFNHGIRPAGPGATRLYAHRSRPIQKMGYLPDQEEKQIYQMARGSGISYRTGGGPKKGPQGIQQPHSRGVLPEHSQKEDNSSPEMDEYQRCRYHGGDEIYNSSGGPDRSPLLLSGPGYQNLESLPGDGPEVPQFNSCKPRDGPQEDWSLPFIMAKHRPRRSDHESDREKQKAQDPSDPSKNCRYPPNLERGPGPKSPGAREIYKMGFCKTKFRETRERKTQAKTPRGVVKSNTRQGRSRSFRWLSSWEETLWERSLHGHELQHSSRIGVPRPRKYHTNKTVPPARGTRSTKDNRSAGSDEPEDRGLSGDSSRVEALKDRRKKDQPDQGQAFNPAPEDLTPRSGYQGDEPITKDSEYLENIVDLADDLDHSRDNNDFIQDHLAKFLDPGRDLNNDFTQDPNQPQ